MSDNEDNNDYQQQDNQEEQQYDADEQQYQQQDEDNNNNNNNNNDNEDYKQQEKQQQKQQQQQYQQEEEEQVNVEPLNDKSPLSSSECWKGLSKDNNVFNWYILTVDGKQNLEYVSRGNGGLKEMHSFLKGKKKELYFGLLRVNSIDKSKAKRAKFVYVRYVGSEVPVMKKAKVTPSLGKIGEQFPVKHLSLDLDENLTKFDSQSLMKEFLRVGGGEKLEKYEFGPGQNVEM
jgi:flagellar biosynthesis GTPase FlhF